MRFLTLRETAAKVGYHKVHIMRLAKAGKFPKPVKMNNFAVRFIDEEIERYMKERIAERDKQAGQVVKLKPRADARQPETSNQKDSKNDRTDQNRNSTSHAGE